MDTRIPSNLDPIEFFTQLPPGMLTCFGVTVVLFWGVFWAIFAAFFQKNLQAIPESHRRLKPGAAWWLVPFPVAIVFLFVLVSRVSDSWKSHLGESRAGSCGKRVGLTSASLALLSNLLSIQPFLGGGATLSTIAQITSAIVGLVGFILLVVYAVILNDLKLKAHAATEA